MGRATTKAELLTSSEEKFQELSELIRTLTEKELSTTFDFTKMKSKTQAHWGRDKNLRDVLIHLYEWHRLLPDWVSANRKGENRPFLPAPYNWKTYGDMNREFWKKHQNTTLEAAKEMLKQSHREVMALAESFTERFEVSVRTIYRDMDALSQAGIPIYAEPGRNGGISLLDSFVLDRALLSEEERRDSGSAMRGPTVAAAAERSIR